MTKFWGTLFGINFAIGVATGIAMEFQFGMNWSYFSHYVGDIFGAPLAIEGLMAFFLEATFVGLFFFGWDKLSQVGHLAVTWAVAVGLQLLGAVDPDRQRLDAEPGRRRLQSRRPCAWRSTDFYRGAVQSRWRRPSSCTPCRRAMSRRRSSCSAFGLVPAARPPHRAGQALDGGRGLASASPPRCRWSCSATRAATCSTEHQKMKLAAIEAHVGDRAGARRPSPSSASPTRKRARPTTPSRSLGAGPDRHPLAHPGDPRHHGAGRQGAEATSAAGIKAYDALQTIRAAKGKRRPRRR